MPMASDLVAANGRPPARCPACDGLLVYGDTPAETECLSCRAVRPTSSVLEVSL